MKITNRLQGNKGEMIALTYLRRRGMHLLEKNYRAGRKEIDLIMREDETIVFVEVKSRTSLAYGTPAESVTANKQRNIIQAAMSYIQQNGYDEYAVRFDVVEVDLNSMSINHISDAFAVER
jgi:putative endonuclease